MTLSNLTNEQKRVKIAEACGWRTCPDMGRLFAKWKQNKTGKLADCDEHLPDYLNDLNAMAEAEKTLTDDQHKEFRAKLWDIVEPPNKPAWILFEEHNRAYASATANQRADAFLLSHTQQGEK